MRLLVIRPGLSMDRQKFARTGKGDDERGLTSEGRKEVTRAARGLRLLVPAMDVLAPSPLIRARQTADIVARAYHMKASQATRALDPDARPRPGDGVLAWLMTSAQLQRAARR